MNEVGYAISVRDYDRVQRAIRKIEALDLSPLYRRFPVLSGSGGGFPYPTERVGVYTTTLQLTKALHEKKLVYVNNYDGMPAGPDGNVTIIAAESPSPGDTYFLHCQKNSVYYVALWPNVGQTIIMPSKTIVHGDGYWVEMGSTGYVSETYQLILVCCAANTWISWAATSSEVINAR